MPIKLNGLSEYGFVVYPRVEAPEKEQLEFSQLDPKTGIEIFAKVNTTTWFKGDPTSISVSLVSTCKRILNYRSIYSSCLDLVLNLTIRR